MGVDPTAINAIGSAVGSLGGIAQTIIAGRQQAQEIESQIRAAQLEAQGLILQGQEASRTAIQNAYAALRDIAFLQDSTKQNIRAIRREGDFAASRVAAITVGQGFALSGSPLLAMADIGLETARRVANEKLTRDIGTERFQFQVDENIRTSFLAGQATDSAVQALLDRRASEVGRAQFQLLQTRLAAVNQGARLFGQSETILKAGQSLFGGEK